jgi:regulator of sigma D
MKKLLYSRKEHIYGYRNITDRFLSYRIHMKQKYYMMAGLEI